jgi:hypothetical protein
MKTKICPDCGENKPLSAFGVRRQDGKQYSRSYCKPCSRKGTRRYRDKNPSARLLQSCKNRAKRTGVPFNLTEADLEIPDVCPVLGIPLVPDYTSRTDNTPSVDRRVPELGYVTGNVVVVSWRANRLKSDATIAELRAMASFYSKEE